MTMFEDKVTEAHKAFQYDINSPLEAKLLATRRLLIEEEKKELFAEIDAAIEALDKGEEIPFPVRENMLKEAADLQYVLSGFYVALGLPIEEVFRRVHKSNMSKLGPGGIPLKRADGKFIKGPNYREPDLKDLVK